MISGLDVGVTIEGGITPENVKVEGAIAVGVVTIPRGKSVGKVNGSVAVETEWSDTGRVVGKLEGDVAVMAAVVVKVAPAHAEEVICVAATMAGETERLVVEGAAIEL